MIQMNLSSTNPVYNDPDICNRSADSFINDPDVSDHLNFKIKLWPKIGQVASIMNFGPHYEFSVTLV
jgi:hypothetical protein